MSFGENIVELVEGSASPLVGIAPWWKRVAQGEIATILNGFPWKSTFFNEQDGVPLIRIRDVLEGRTDTLYGGPVEQGYWIKEGDLLVGMDGDFNAAHWRGPRGLLNQRVCKITPDEHFYLKDFLARVLPGYLQLINEATHSITVKHLSSRTLAEVPLPLPPLPEQRRIVAKIDSLSANSSRARDHLDHIPRLVKEYKQAVLAAAFDGSLSGRSETHNLGDALLEEAREKHRALARSQGGRAPSNLSPDEHLFDLPKGWAWAAAEEIVEPGADIVYGIVQPGPKLDAGVAYVRGTDIADGKIKLEQLLYTSPEIAARYERASLAGGDVLLGIIRATKVAIVPPSLKGANITQGTARFRPSPAISTKYLALWLDSSIAQRWLHARYRGIDMPGLNLRDVRRLPVPLASRAEQALIVRYVETAFTRIEGLAAEAISARKLVDHLDQAILAKAFRGELVPEDPADEPASALLARIKAERTSTGETKRRGRKPKVA